MAKNTLPITDFSEEEIGGLKAELEQSGIPFKETDYLEMDATGGRWPAVLVELATPATISLLAHAITSYFKHRKRKVVYNYMTGEESLEGYSADEVVKIIEARKDGRIQIGDRKPRNKGHQ